MALRFRVRSLGPGDLRVCEETRAAPSEALLRQEFAVQGRTVLSVERLAAAERLMPARMDVPWWCRELRTLLVAGMTVVEAVETLQAQAREPARQQVMADLLRALRQGQSLSTAMRGTGVFPEVLLASVTASERTSALEAALDDYLRYDTLLQGLRRRALSAAIYPLVVVALGLAITVFLLMYVVPRFSLMYTGLRGEVSLWTQMLLGLSALLSQYRLALLALLAAIAAGLAWAWRTGLVLRGLNALIEGVGPLRRQWDHFRCAKLFHSLALMFKGGYTVDEALQVCTGLGLGARLTAGIELARTELARGRAVSGAFEAAHLTDGTAMRLLAVADRTGGFAAVLQTVADRHAQAFEAFVERASRLIEPVLMLGVALLVGGIVVMMYMPIFDIANGIR